MKQPSHLLLFPGAGAGRRMQSALPKQYLPFAGRMLGESTLDRLSLLLPGATAFFGC